MTTKEYLSQLWDYELRINVMLEESRKWRSIAEKCTTTFGDTAGGSCNGDRIPRMVEKINELEVQINAEIAKLVDKRAEVHAVIAKVPDARFRELLSLRYIMHYTFERIAVQMHYSWRQVIRMHGRALQVAEDVIECHIDSVI